MMSVRRGSHVWNLLCLIGEVGEIPQQSMGLMGSKQTVKRVVSKMCKMEEYLNPETGERIKVKAFNKTGSRWERTIRITAKGKKLLEWVGKLERYKTVTYNCNLSSNDTHVLRNHKLAEVIIMLTRAGVSCSQDENPKLTLSYPNQEAITKPVFYTSRTLKTVDPREDEKLRYVLTLGAVISSYRSYAVYNTRDKAMSWNGEGEFKTCHMINRLAFANSISAKVYGCIFFAKDEQVLLDTINQSKVRFAFKTPDGRWTWKKRTSVQDIYEKIHYIPLDENGVRILRIMMLPNYLGRIRKMMFDKGKVFDGYTYKDGMTGDVQVALYIDGNITKLLTLKSIVEDKKNKDDKYEVICYDFQYPFVKELLGARVSYKLLSIDILEEALGLPKWKNT